MADPVIKARYEELKTTYDLLQNRLRTIESEMFDVGVQLGTIKAQLQETGEVPKTFNDKVKMARIKTGGGITGIFPHPIDKPSVMDSEANF